MYNLRYKSVRTKQWRNQSPRGGWRHAYNCLKDPSVGVLHNCERLECLYCVLEISKVTKVLGKGALMTEGMSSDHVNVFLLKFLQEFKSDTMKQAVLWQPSIFFKKSRIESDIF